MSMTEEQASRAVEKINEYLQAKPGFDFQVEEYAGYRLTVKGRPYSDTDHEVEIYFDRVFMVSLPMAWRSGTSAPALRLLDGEEAVRINLRFKIEYLHHNFSFRPEGFPEDLGCIVSSQEISFAVIEGGRDR